MAEVKKNGMTAIEMESYLRKNLADKYRGNLGKPIYVA
jgi:hypothetical protein